MFNKLWNKEILLGMILFEALLIGYVVIFSGFTVAGIVFSILASWIWAVYYENFSEKKALKGLPLPLLLTWLFLRNSGVINIFMMESLLSGVFFAFLVTMAISHFQDFLE